MRANLIPVIVGRSWQIAEGYHAIELRTTSGSVLPPFADGASIALCRNHAGNNGRIYPLLHDSSLSNTYVVGARQRDDRKADSPAAGFPMKEGDEAFVGMPISPPTVLDDRVRSILYAAGIGAASIAGIAKRLASAGQKFEVHHFARSADQAVHREVFDAIQNHGKVYRYFGLPDDLVVEKSAHAMSPTHPTTQIYCSGPLAFMDFIEHQGREWVYAENIHKIVLGEQHA
ncbi:oxidoreductase [Paraburkholderia sp. HD33-4]|uniref:oxidoreductase n=1 Tax=Paraburkholderia sp. HD33-4 TaxID=2883242 RepID=UPI001F2E1427|nr:oxidoreductase [Paraburkholderia sp. HD33-4]